MPSMAFASRNRPRNGAVHWGEQTAAVILGALERGRRACHITLDRSSPSVVPAYGVCSSTTCSFPYSSIRAPKATSDIVSICEIAALSAQSLFRWHTSELSVAAGRGSAMCGRLRVGKENLHVAGLGRCGHVFGL
jgi:hypothetical protein